MFGLMIADATRRAALRYSGALTARWHRRANTKTGRDGLDRVEDLMGKQRREQSQDSIFVDNPFVDGFLEWMGSREGRQCIEVRDVLWDLLEDAELDAKQRQLIWPDAERLDLVQIHSAHPKTVPGLPWPRDRGSFTQLDRFGLRSEKLFPGATQRA